MSKEKNMKKINWTTLIAGIVSLMLTLAYLGYLLIAARGSENHDVSGRPLKYYVLMILCIVSVVFAIRDKIIFHLYVGLLFLFTIWYAFADIHYSPIDEFMHFESINHIAKYNELPLFDGPIDIDYINAANNNADNLPDMPNYEAVQAPLFYILMALPSKLVSGAADRLHMQRILCLGMVAIIGLFMYMTIHYLEKKKILVVDPVLYRAAVLLTIYCPAYLYRAARVSNETLVCVLMAILLYVLVRLIVEGYSAKKYWISALLCVGCFMTKNTSIYAYIAFGVVVIMQKKILKAILPVFATGCLTLPWFWSNYQNYGSLTAMRRHFQFVLPVVNPSRQPQNLFEIYFDHFGESFFTGEEVFLSRGEAFWANMAYMLMLCMFIYVAADMIRTFREKKLNFEGYGVKLQMNIMGLALCLGCVAALSAGTIISTANSIHGRYFYSAVVAVVLMLQLNKNSLSVRIWKYIMMVMIVVAGILAARGLVFFFNAYYSSMNLFA